eukprot:4357650-Lingulodinium_polyedra.AAC.1
MAGEKLESGVQRDVVRAEVEELQSVFDVQGVGDNGITAEEFSKLKRAVGSLQDLAASITETTLKAEVASLASGAEAAVKRCLGKALAFWAGKVQALFAEDPLVPRAADIKTTFDSVAF